MSEKEMFPVVSVITVCYNAEKLIARVLESVLSQTYGEFEYIIKDGGSTDRTNQIIEKYKERFQEKGIPVRHISEKDQGLYYAMNAAVSVCKGQFVNFMNADDRFYDEQVLERIFREKTYEEADILYGDALECEFGEYYYFPKNIENIKRRMPFNHQATFVRREVMLQYPFDTKYRIGADYNFLLTAYDQGLRFVDLNTLVSIIAKEGVSTVNLYDTFVESTVIRKSHGIELYSDKEYKRKLAYTKCKQFGMNFFPNWLKYIIRRIQRKMRGQSNRAEYRGD